jgi:uncharacterized protein YheU (UPF0270 family)
MEIPHEKLDPDTLRRVLEEIVSREGTDYGERVYSFDEKVDQALEMLRIRKAALVFDQTTETVNLIPRHSDPPSF